MRAVEGKGCGARARAPKPGPLSEAPFAPTLTILITESPPMVTGPVENSRLAPPHDTATKKLRMTPIKDLLDDGKIEALVACLRQIAAEHALLQPGLTENILKEAEYFETNIARMRYPDFRAKGLFVGSGVVEAGCKTVIGSRLKRSGMFWTLRAANAIIALRCCRLNGRFEDYWEENRAAA